MRASQKLQERCDWIRIVNRLDLDIAVAKLGRNMDKAGELMLERLAAVEELAKLGYVVSR